MLLLITYDVNVTTKQGRTRLRRIAKTCVDYGQRVQNSVFECSVDAATAKLLKAKLIKLIDPQEDSLRFYNLGNNYNSRIEHIGTKTTYDPEGLLMV